MRVPSIASGLLALLTAASAEAATVPAGASLVIRTQEHIDSARMGANAKFTAVLEGNLSVDGAVVVPAGAKVYGQLLQVKKARRLVGRPEVTLALVQINVDGDILKIRTSGVRAVGEKKGGQTVRKAAAGAAIGAMFGGGEGAAYGAAAGATAALLTQGSQINIPAGTLLDFTLADPLEVKGSSPAPAAAAPAINATELALKVAEARTRAGKAMLTYNWKQRTEVKRGKKSEYVKLELIRFDLDGNLQRTLMSESGKTGGPGQKLVEAIPTLRSYALPSAGSILDFMQSADVSPLEGGIVAVGQDVLQSGDRLTMRIDPETYAIEKVDVRTSLEGKPTTAVVEYATKGEAVYPVRARLQVGDDVEIVIEAFDVNEG